MVTEKIFEAALGIGTPWYIGGMGFDRSARRLKVRIDFEVGSRFAVEGHGGCIRCTTPRRKRIGI